ncbi:hypothetical protein [Saccharothrix luteola]|uniref:hypothetical protein n=1 Tax=Saccharothrix luteola TaxID=2893018 RepID=UPI001E649CF4|nr:hypothetical protein [Saccharothrix luteola]MCC8245012.1 hypothetical protein [Saccharothrix luteola]
MAELERLVIEQYPAARITLEVSRQLVRLLPISSAENLRRNLEKSPLEVDGETIDLGRAIEALPEEIFPIDSVGTLVEKVSAAVQIVGVAVREGHLKLGSEHFVRLAQDAVVMATAGRPGIPAGHFTGPSLFGYTRGE